VPISAYTPHTWIARRTSAQLPLCGVAIHLQATYFCIDCGGATGALCQHCLHQHMGHQVLQIRRYVYCDVVRAADISPSFDVSGIQVRRDCVWRVLLAHLSMAILQAVRYKEELRRPCRALHPSRAADIHNQSGQGGVPQSSPDS